MVHSQTIPALAPLMLKSDGESEAQGTRPLENMALVWESGSGGWTRKHEEGRCAMHGQCGSQSFFGASLPCPNNLRAEEPVVQVRKKLVDICGAKWLDGPVCCDEEQVSQSRADDHCYIS